METIRNYLESMFATLPNTAEVLQAKYELGQMMEDKYTELLSEGKAENEAVGIVISEVGNLEEIAEALGIQNVLQKREQDPLDTVSMDEVRGFIQDSSRAGFLRGLGVLLCICCPVGTILAADNTDKAMAIGVALLFIAIAAGVGLFIYTSIYMSRWDKILKRRCRIDYGTASYVGEQKQSFRITRALMLTVGVILCIISVVPVSVMGLISASDGMTGYGAALIFVFVGIGVMLIIASSQRNGAYSTLLNLNAPGTVGGTYRNSDGEEEVYYENKTVGAIMSVYWPTVTCIYLAVSFLTFAWGITWIIWPIAAIIETLIKKTLGTAV